MVIFYIEVALMVFFSYHSVLFLICVIMFTTVIPEIFYYNLMLSMVRYSSSLKDRNQRNMLWEKFFLEHRREVADLWFRFWFIRIMQLTPEEKELFYPILRKKPSNKKDMEIFKTMGYWTFSQFLITILSVKLIQLPDQVFFYTFSLSSLLLCYFAFAYYDKRFKTLSYCAQKAHELKDS